VSHAVLNQSTVWASVGSGVAGLDDVQGCFEGDEFDAGFVGRGQADGLFADLAGDVGSQCTKDTVLAWLLNQFVQVFAGASRTARMRRSTTRSAQVTNVARMELLGSPEVHRALGELVIPLVDALQKVSGLHRNPQVTVDDYESLFGSEEMQVLAERVGAAEIKLRDLMRRDFGHGPLGKVDLLGPDGSQDS
jgi:hypothetical protein